MPSEVSPVGRDQSVEELRRELAEAREQQAATSEILRVISRSPTDAQPVFDTILSSAVRLLGGYSGVVGRIAADQIELAAFTSIDAAGDASLRAVFPQSLESETAHARAVRARAPINIADTQTDPDTPEAIRASARARGYRSWITVPLLRDNEAVGTIAVTRRQAGGFSDDEISLLQTFADQAVIAIENTRLFEAEQARTRELTESLEYQTAISDVLAVIGSSPNELQPVFDAIVRSASRLCGGEYAIVTRYDGALLHLVAQYNPRPATAEETARSFPRPARREASLGARALLDGVVINIADVEADDLIVPVEQPVLDYYRRIGLRALLAVPMIHEGRPIGTIVVSRGAPGLFSKRQVGLLRTFADQAVIAIENTRLFEAEQASKRELQESLEYQTATSDVLGVIATSPTNIQPVLQTLVESACGLCGAYDGLILLREGDWLQVKAHHGPIPANLAKRKITRDWVNGRCVADGVQIHLRDLQAEATEYPEGAALAQRLGARTILSTPLMREGKAIGAIMIRRDEVRPFSDKQIGLIETFADQAVIAIENTRLFKEVQEKNHALTEAHAQVSGALERETATSEILRVIGSSPTDVHPVFETIARSGVSVCGALGCVVLVVDGGMIRLAATHGVRPERLERFRHEYPLPLSAEIDTAQTIRSRRMFHLADIENNPNATATDIENARLAGYRTRLMVPMVRGDRTLGLIAVTREDPTPFPDQLVELLRTFADQAVIAIENTRLFEEVQARTEELTESLEYQTAIADVLRAIGQSPTDITPIMTTILKTARRLCGAEAGNVFALSGSSYRMIARDGIDISGVDAKVLAEAVLELDRSSMTGRVALEGRTLQVTDVQVDPDLAYFRELGNDPRRTALGVPLLLGGKVVGVINLYRDFVEPFSGRQVTLVETFADQAVIAIENARLFEAEQASKRELQEALEQQTATTDVLQVISSSPGDLQPVFDGILTKATQVCGANFGNLFLCEGEVFRHVAMFGAPPEFAELRRRNPVVKSAPNSILDRLTTTKQLQHIRDFREELSYLDRVPASVELVEIAGARTVLGVPLVKANKVIGTIAIYRRHVEPFTDKQIELVKNFADQAVIAIENTRLLNELREALQQQTATADVLKVISRATFDLPKVLDTLVESAASLCDSYDTAILQKDGDVLHIVSHRGHIPSIGRQGTVPRTRGSAAWRAVLDRQTIHLADAQSETDEYPHSSAIAQRLGYHTLLAVPLIGAGEAVGVITLRRSEVRSFTDKQIDLLQTFADQAVIAIENTRLFEEVQGRTRELTESLEYQTATSEVLNVISHSPTNAQPVFDAIVQSAARLCEAVFSVVWLYDGELLHCAASHNFTPEVLDHVRKTYPKQPDRSVAAGRAILDCRISHVPDTLADPAYARQLALAGNWRASLSVPMLRDGKPVGALSLGKAEAVPFSERQTQLLTTFANQAVIAIENARLFEEVQARNRDLTALGEIGRAVSSTLNLKVVLKTIVERAVDLSGTHGGSIFYYRAKVGRFELGETTGLDEETIARFRKLDIATGETGLGEAINQRQPLQVPDILKRPSNTLRDAALEAGLRAALIVPLFAGEDPLGALVLQRRHPGEFSPTVVNLVQSFADQSAIALENARLFDEIAQKGRELEIASQHKSQFVANMSHELRTPLAAILGYAELMQEGFYEPQGKKSLEALTRIRSNGKHLLGLINTVLDIAKIESGQFSLNVGEYAIESVVETVRAATESLAETKKLALKTEVAKKLPVGLGDEQRLTQVLLNLVGNAIKFTDTGEVRITATAMNGHFTVAVTDTGPGIPAEELNRVFDQFHQIDNSNTKAKGGTGLGLALAKQIVEMHGGRIWVESTLGQGATFQMQLPIRAEAKKAAE